jgi:localization factor PodJL
VIEQVSDERITKLFDYDSRFSADIEAVAKRAAEEVHNRLMGGDAHDLSVSSRHDELRSLIEASIRDRREADVQAVSLVSGLSGRVNEQSDRYDELKDILQQAIQEQRQNEQTAFGMLDTLQQALVTILDRMDVLEQNQHTAALAPTPAAPTARSEFVEPPYAPLAREAEPEALDASGQVPYSFRDTRYDFSGSKEPRETPPPLKSTESYFEESVQDTSEPAQYAVSEDAESPVDKLRRDFVADARRAKLKAAANRAEEMTAEKTGTGVGSVSQTRASLVQSFRSPEGTGSGRIFGMSTKLLAGVLALIVAINGGLLLLNRKSAPPPAPAISHSSETAPEASNKQDHQSDLPNPGPRSELRSGALPPYGLNDDILNPPEVETLGSAIPSEPPSGMTVTGSDGAVPPQAVAEVYEQQVLAGLSGQLGMIAAGQSADAMLPEKSGRIDATYTPAPLPGSEGAAGTSALDLPPATVGPMSLRLAAANGDASAEFEVAARLAEGKGTGQNYAEAIRWYQRSAAKGFAQSQYRLGTLYERGLGVDKDIERAKIWYSRAAEQGNVKAMHNLAVLNASGDAPNFAAAAPWFLKAAEYGLADSQYNLGVLLENGLAGKTDPVAAYKWYALAAKGGDKDATERKDAMKSQLAKQDLTAAEDLVANFRARPASPLANDARTAGEDWKKRLTDTNT